MDTDYRVVMIAADVEKHPECASDTKHYPQLVRYAYAEVSCFIVHETDGSFWKPDEFFAQVPVRRFRMIDQRDVQD